MPIESKVVDIVWKVITALPRGASWVIHAGWRDHGALHHPLYGRNLVSATQAGSRCFYIDLAVAPSKSLGPGAQLPRPQTFRESLDEMGLTNYPTVPNHSTGEVIVFEVREADQTPIRRAELWKTGLLAIQEQLSVSYGNGRELDALEIAEIVHRVATGISAGAYARLLDIRFPFSRRIDWFTAVTPAVTGLNGQDQWSDLVFPDEKPTIRASDARPWVPPSGYRAGSSRGTRQSMNPDQILAQFMRSMLLWCGYLECDDSVASLLNTVGTRH